MVVSRIDGPVEVPAGAAPEPPEQAAAGGWAAGARLPGGLRLLRPIGGGATAEVWEAEGPAGPVAVKALRAEWCGRPAHAEALRREGRKARLVRHPSLVAMFATDEAQGRPYLVMELLHGATLQANWPGRLPRRRVAALLAGPAAALARLHAAGLVHGDVKPGNLFLEYGGTVRLLDLGAMRMVAGSALDESNWSPPHGLPMATPRWAAPERLRGEPPDPRDDVHALARVAAEMLAGPMPRTLRAALGPRAGRPANPESIVAALRPWSLPLPFRRRSGAHV